MPAEEFNAANAYCQNLRADVEEDVNESPRALVHRAEWNKIMNGDPVEINPSMGSGYKVNTIIVFHFPSFCLVGNQR